MKIETDKKQKHHLLNGQVEIVADDLRNNETILKKIEENTKLLNEIESTYSRRLNEILSKIIRVINETKRVDDVAIKENLIEQQKIIEQRHNKLCQEYWGKKRNILLKE